MGILNSEALKGNEAKQLSLPEMVPQNVELSEHDLLVETARKWLSVRAKIVATEIKAVSEEPDAIGFEPIRTKIGHGSGSVLIECKASRSDFKADSRKLFRMYPEQGMGTYRYYLAPKGLIKPEELPDKWGLLELCGKRVRRIKTSEPFMERNIEGELLVMCSIFRRLNITEGEGVSIRVFTIETNNTASLTLSE